MREVTIPFNLRSICPRLGRFPRVIKAGHGICSGFAGGQLLFVQGSPALDGFELIPQLSDDLLGAAVCLLKEDYILMKLIDDVLARYRGAAISSPKRVLLCTCRKIDGFVLRQKRRR